MENNKIEKTYGGALRGVFYAVNPLKKKFLKTYCTVHKFITLQSLEVLKNDGYKEEYEFFKGYIGYINEGTTWADQDFKSSNHFFHFSKGKGLYGFSNALTECRKYYETSIGYINEGDIPKSMFYLGAACHLIQDVTVPQHVNNKLLKNHRKFELWIISKLLNDYAFMADSGVVRYKDLDSYIINNAFLANNTYLKNISNKNVEERYYAVASTILKAAQRTTAGFMIDYYEAIKNNHVK
ncbi:zinc dependent phospholipase C family protein [Clostridium malenominatum]|uniref:Phospholipase C n=1 Tax=Clostridium malenominatum TaxID=1539 RepID=A0ABP3U0L7_9CLOT